MGIGGGAIRWGAKRAEGFVCCVGDEWVDAAGWPQASAWGSLTGVVGTDSGAARGGALYEGEVGYESAIGQQ